MTDDDLLHQPNVSPVIIHLLKGILFRNQHPALWNDLLELQTQVLDYVKIIGLDLEIDDFNFQLATWSEKNL